MNGLVAVPEAARILNRHPSTLAQWRIWGRGPKFLYKGRKVYYKKTELMRWKSQSTKS